MLRPRIPLDTQPLEGLADLQFRGDLGKRDARGLADERCGPRCARVDFQHVHDAVLHRILDIHQTDDMQRQRQLPRVRDQFMEL